MGTTRVTEEERLIRYRRLRTAVQLNAGPEAPGRLRELERRLRDELLATRLFVDLEAGHTDDPDRLVIALGQFGPGLDERDVARCLAWLWQEKLRYSLWEAHAILVDQDHVELQGATRGDSHGPYVTMHVVVRRARVPLQRAPLN
ncbi:hypothetical protein [Nocardioides caldifontis]|uniref:hypothetical protein n=1 Tax=Nocardioides caldifontis TaxID=2588938 RepID=UPI0011DFBDC8|nr:hypothetical protein [Nocardioides caldifontis]